jgi:recombination DNA repair RAD52 pathway protein
MYYNITEHFHNAIYNPLDKWWYFNKVYKVDGTENIFNFHDEFHNLTSEMQSKSHKESRIPVSNWAWGYLWEHKYEFGGG